jgi:hypothetical protein
MSIITQIMYQYTEHSESLSTEMIAKKNDL